MKRILWALLLVSVVDKAIAGDSQFQGLQQQAAAEAQVLPSNNAWGQRAIGVSSRPSVENQESPGTPQEEERGSNSYSAPSSSDGDD